MCSTISSCCVSFFKGILNDDGTLNNDASCLRLAEVALAYARAGKSVLFFFCFFCKYYFLFRLCDGVTFK